MLLRVETNFEGSRPDAFCKKRVLRNFAKFTGKHLCQGLLKNFIKKENLAQMFHANFAKFLRTPFFIEQLWWLLLQLLCL